MPTRTEHIECPQCGVARPILIDWPNKITVAATRRCVSCANSTRNTNRHQPEPDTLVVEFLIAGTKVKANPAERYAAVAYLSARRLTIKAIADRLHCTTRTVERHRKKLAAA
jgi:DNA-binding NarL/FixJ family response regulator